MDPDRIRQRPRKMRRQRHPQIDRDTYTLTQRQTAIDKSMQRHTEADRDSALEINRSRDTAIDRQRNR